jgi:biotin synthase
MQRRNNGMGESIEDRAGMLCTFYFEPTRISTNKCFGCRGGTPMEEEKPVEIWEMIEW